MAQTLAEKIAAARKLRESNAEPSFSLDPSEKEDTLAAKLEQARALRQAREQQAQVQEAIEEPTLGGEIAGGFARGLAETGLGAPVAMYGMLTAPARELSRIGMFPEQVTPPRVTPGEVSDILFGTEEPETPAGRAAELLGASAIPGAGVVGLARPGARLGAAGLELAAAGGAAVGQEIGGPVGAIVGGGLMATALPGLGRIAARLDIRPSTARKSREIIEHFDRQEIPFTVSNLGQNTQYMERLSARFPGGYGMTRKVADAQMKQFEKRVFDLTDEVDDFSAGKAIKSGVEGWVSNNFKPTAGRLYDDIWAHIPQQAPTKLGNTKGFLQAEVDKAGKFAKWLVHPSLRGIRRKLKRMGKTGGMTFEQLMGLRSAVGSKLSSPDLVSDIPRAQLKRLYGALSDDIRDTVALAGPAAEKAFDRASNYWKKGMERVDNYLDKLEGVVEPEKVFEYLVSATEKVPTRAIQIAKSMKPREREIAVSAMLRKLGVPKPGQRTMDYSFSPNTYYTNLNKIRPEAWQAMTRGTRFSRMSDLNDLRFVADRLRETEKYLPNPSGTAQVGIGAGALGAGATGGAMAGGPIGAVVGGMAGALTSLATTSAGAWAMSSLLSSPKFVRWAASGMRMSPEQLGPHLARLSSVVEGEPGGIQESALILQKHTDEIVKARRNQLLGGGVETSRAGMSAL